MSREAFGFAVALQNLVWGLAQPLAGLLADRHGARPIVLGASILYATGLAVAASASNELMFTLGLGLLAGLGQAGTAFAVILAVIGRASPDDARSFALGVGATAGSIGMFVLVPAAGALVASVDWRWSLLVLAALIAAAAPLALALTEDDTSSLQPRSTASASAALRAIGRDRDYWLLNVGFAACGFQLAFIATYIPILVLDAGLGLWVGGAVLATIGVTNIAGTYLAGLAGGRWPKARTLAAVYVARAVVIAGFLALPLSAASLIVFGALIGVLWTGTVPLTNALVADLWGRRNLAFLFGLVYVGHQLGAFAGAWVGGFVFDRTGSFDLVWAAILAMSAAAAAFHLILHERPRALALAERGDRRQSALPD